MIRNTSGNLVLAGFNPHVNRFQKYIKKELTYSCRIGLILSSYFYLRAREDMSANEKQVDGDHYQTKIQPWDFIEANRLTFIEGNIVKYVCRHRQKNGLKDLKKAKHYLEKLIEVETAKESAKNED